ncbi:TPA: hypothetical protein HA244_01815 [Candidatus Micrarchaeota archaeon]|nr:hypothetical protein [Candidatus Micrarchaeota archaeon]
MEYASVKVFKTTLKKAKRLKGKLMQEEGERTSDAEVFDRALNVAQKYENDFLHSTKGNWQELKKFAGSWKMSDREAQELIDEIYERRKSWRRFV